MPAKEEHVHIVTDEEHKKILKRLGEKFGSMTKAFESAIEALEKQQTFGSCDDCEMKFELEQNNNFRELLNTATMSADTIRELIKYLKGDCTIQEFFMRNKEMAFQFGKQYFSFLKIFPDNTYENLLAIIEEWKKVTRLFESIKVDRFAKKIIARINIFEDLPIFVVVGFLGYLEALDFTFDIDIIQADIIIQWIEPEKYPQVKDQIQEKIISYIEKAGEEVKPYLVKKGFLLTTPQFLDWISETLLISHLIPTHLAYHFASLTIGEVEQPESAEYMAKLSVDTIKRINFAEEISSSYDNLKKSFKLSIFCRAPGLTRIILQAIILILAKWGWKLKRHRMESSRLDVGFSYVGENDPSILEPLYVTNFPGYLNQRFQTLRLIPVDEYDDLTKGLYELDPDILSEVFRKQGIKMANAIKLLAKNDLKKMREIALQALPQTLKQTQRDPDGIDFIPENKRFTMIFKTTDIVQMEILRSVILGVVEGFEYSDIKSKILENIVTIEFTRPYDLETISPSIE